MSSEQQQSAMDSNQKSVTLTTTTIPTTTMAENNENISVILVNNCKSNSNSNSNNINEMPLNILKQSRDESESKNKIYNLSDQYSDDTNKKYVESELVSLKHDDDDDNDDAINDDVDDDVNHDDEEEEKVILGQNELSVTHIKDFVKVKHEMEEISLHEELDALSPLMTDNHTILEHHEIMLPDDRVFPEFIPRSRMRLSETKDSISSIDSDLSLSFDRRNSQESNNHTGDISDHSYHSSDDNNKDSGCETVNKINNTEEIVQAEPPIEIPDDDLAEKIIEQVEFYFSNENILKDAFLLKHVRRNKEGFVSLKLISSFKRVRQLAKDWRVVGYAIKLKSKKIELNDLETKVRRLEALPNYDETTPSRTVVATDLPFEKITIEKVSDLFSKCGEIALVRILRPGNQIPADVRQFINKYSELQQNDCALIEFVESNSARVAQHMEGLKVYEMIAPKKKTGKKQSVTKLIENCKYNESEMERSRGGGDYQYGRIKRNNSGYYTKPEHMCSPRKISFNNENFEHFHRRISNCSGTSADGLRKFSNCSEGYSSCSEVSRRPSTCSDISRRTSNCSDILQTRRTSCTEHCHCSRRLSQCSDIYRRMSQCSEHNRKFSGGSNNFERRLSNTSDIGRRVSIDSNFERKFSNGSIGFEPVTRKCSTTSTGFDPIRQITSSEQYFGNRKFSTDSNYDRRISIDSGYDRKLSMGSDYSGPEYIYDRKVSMTSDTSGPRSRSTRTPIGPDGSKGFRTRKVGQINPPV